MDGALCALPYAVTSTTATASASKTFGSGLRQLGRYTTANLLTPSPEAASVDMERNELLEIRNQII